MGFTKKQRREQKKHALTARSYEKVKRKQHRGRSSYPDQQTDTMPGQDTVVSQPGPLMVLVKTGWTDQQGASHQDFQLVEIPAGRDQESVREDFLANLQAHHVQNSSVELFDPDNVPSGTIPPDATITMSKPLFNN